MSCVTPTHRPKRSFAVAVAGVKTWTIKGYLKIMPMQKITQELAKQKWRNVQYSFKHSGAIG